MKLMILVSVCGDFNDAGHWLTILRIENLLEVVFCLRMEIGEVEECCRRGKREVMACCDILFKDLFSLGDGQEGKDPASAVVDNADDNRVV